MQALRTRWLSLLSLAIFFSIWEVLCRTGVVSPILLSPPTRIAVEGWTHLGSGRWNEDFEITFLAFALSILIASLLGTVAGVAMGASRALFHLVNPYVIAMNALPKIVICPLIMLWFGTGLSARVFLGVVMAGFPIIVSTLTGVQSVDRDFLLLARAYGASRRTILVSILLPAITPFVLSGMRVGVNYAMVGILIVEFFASSRGIGYRLYAYSQNFQIDLFFVLLVVVVGFTLVMTSLVHRAELHFGAWRDAAFRA